MAASKLHHTGNKKGLRQCNPLLCLVPRAGVEPAHRLRRGILSPLCLPISPPRQIANCCCKLMIFNYNPYRGSNAAAARHDSLVGDENILPLLASTGIQFAFPVCHESLVVCHPIVKPCQVQPLSFGLGRFRSCRCPRPPPARSSCENLTHT